MVTETAIEYKVNWDHELERRKALGITAPDPLPHPDHIIIDVNTGAVRITGPMTKEDKARWDRWRQRKEDTEAEIAELNDLLAANPNHPQRDQILQELDHQRRLKEMFSKSFLTDRK